MLILSKTDKSKYYMDPYIGGYFFLKFNNMPDDISKISVKKTRLDKNKEYFSFFEMEDSSHILEMFTRNIFIDYELKIIYLTFIESSGLPILLFFKSFFEYEKKFNTHDIINLCDIYFWTTTPDYYNIEYCAKFKGAYLITTKETLLQQYSKEDTTDASSREITIQLSFSSYSINEDVLNECEKFSLENKKNEPIIKKKNIFYFMLQQIKRIFSYD